MYKEIDIICVYVCVRGVGGGRVCVLWEGVCVRQREKERERDEREINRFSKNENKQKMKDSICKLVTQVCVKESSCVSMCVKERERERVIIFGART